MKIILHFSLIYFVILHLLLLLFSIKLRKLEKWNKWKKILLAIPFLLFYVCVLFITDARILIFFHSYLGKTSIINKFIFKTPRQTSATIATDFQTKVLVLDSRKVVLQIWDTAGQVSNPFYTYFHAYYFHYFLVISLFIVYSFETETI